MDSSALNREERDLLIELRTDVKRMGSDIAKISDGMNARLSLVEREKMDRTEYNRLQSEQLGVNVDHEDRIRKIENGLEKLSTTFKVWGSVVVGFLSLVQFAIQFFLK